MRLFDDAKENWARLFDTPSGKRLLGQLTEEAAQQEKAMEERRALDAQIKDVERRRREESPGLRAAAMAARADVERIRQELDAADRAASDADAAAWRADYLADTMIQRAKNLLARTAAPSLLGAIEKAADRREEFRNYGHERLRFIERRTVLVPPDSSDPDFRSFRRQGISYRMERIGTNRAALAEVVAQMDAALDALRLLALRVEAPSKEEIDLLLVAFAAKTWEEAATHVVWREPVAPKFDKDGLIIAA